MRKRKIKELRSELYSATMLFRAIETGQFDVEHEEFILSVGLAIRAIQVELKKASKKCIKQRHF